MDKGLEETSKEDIPMARNYMKRCSTWLIIREMKIKSTIRHHLTSLRMAIIKKGKDNKLNSVVRNVIGAVLWKAV